MPDFPEIRTLIFAITVVTVCRAAAMMYAWFIARQYAPVRFWAVGSVLVGAGAVLVGLRGELPPVVSIILGQSFVLTGWLLIDGGILIAAGARPPWRTGVSLVVLAIAGVGWYHFVHESFAWRTVAVTVPEILFDVYAGMACLRARNTMRGTLRLLAVSLWLLALSNGIKLTFIVERDIGTLFLPNWQISQFYVVAMIVTVFGTILSLLLVTQHTQQALFDELAAHRTAEIELRLALMRADQFRLALENVPSIVYIKDRQSRFTYANPPAIEFFGGKAQELIGSSGDQFIAPEVHRAVIEREQAVLAGDTIREEFRTDSGPDEQRVYLQTKTPVYENPERTKIIGLCGIATEITEIKNHERLLEHVAHIDPLTGLPNRLMLSEFLDKALAASVRHNRPVGVAFIDLDGFKSVNDDFGHDAGDFLLTTLAQRLSGALRKGDTLARVGGDEFVAVLVDLEPGDAFNRAMQRLLEAASTAVTIGNSPVRVSASIGTALCPDDGTQADQLIRHADEAMYQAKRLGRNQCLRYDQLANNAQRIGPITPT